MKNKFMNDLITSGKVFTSKDNCYNYLNEVRKLYNSSVTEDEALEAYKRLHEMVIFCPGDIIGSVESAIIEFEFRMNCYGICLNIDKVKP